MPNLRLIYQSNTNTPSEKSSAKSSSKKGEGSGASAAGIASNPYRSRGRLLRGLSGLYVIDAITAEEHAAIYGPDSPSPLAGQTVFCRAKGAFRHEGLSPLCGDLVEFSYSDASFTTSEDGTVVPSPDGTGLRIEEICPRRNALIRPPMANLDYLCVVLAAASPDPVLSTVDKLLSIAEFNRVEPLIVITKCELDEATAASLEAIYAGAGYRVFKLRDRAAKGLCELRAALDELLPGGHVAAFAGASGVGKSTLVNALFPDFALEVGDVSRKTERGRHTTRRVELYAHRPADASPEREVGYLADTPGFSMLDFVHFDFFAKDDLPLTMREFEPFIGKCRYTTCTHTKEEDCAIVRAVARGEIAKSRHDSFLEMYEALKNKHNWDK